MATRSSITGLPPGFKLDEPASELPSGFELDEPASALPEGFQLDEPATRLVEADVFALDTERNLGQIGMDLVSSFGQGSNALLKTAGDLYGLATGDLENFASRQGREGIDFFENLKSQELKNLELQRTAKIDAADDTLTKAGTAFWETLSSPSLLTSFVVEQIPLMVPGGLVGRGLGVTAKALGAAGKMANLVTVGGAVGTGAALQSGDIGGGAYDELMRIPDDVWRINPKVKEQLAAGVSLEDAKKDIALNLSRNTAIAAAIVSIGTNMLPGARTIEKTLSGVKLPPASKLGGAIQGFLGESVQESLEEGGGQFLSNIGVSDIDPTKKLSAGVGEAIGISAIGGGVVGGLTGAVRPAVARTVTEPEVIPPPTIEVAPTPTVEAAPELETAQVEIGEATKVDDAVAAAERVVNREIELHRQKEKARLAEARVEVPPVIREEAEPLVERPTITPEQIKARELSKLDEERELAKYRPAEALKDVQELETLIETAPAIAEVAKDIELDKVQEIAAVGAPEVQPSDASARLKAFQSTLAEGVKADQAGFETFMTGMKTKFDEASELLPEGTITNQKDFTQFVQAQTGKKTPLNEINLTRKIIGEGGKVQVVQVKADVVLRQTRKKRNLAVKLLRCIYG